ncbi:hypothetical protein K438DRAFT_1802325 [Mycena galopus ATCC 62051]|nr:hypothetical protein K438DRAFT_1802325 [Mycena galopus ATCC 62051]
MSPRCKNLVLDAGPLLSLSPLRGLAETYLTVPQVLAELKDKRAREHFERLGLNAGVKVEVVAPDAASLAAVIAGAKKTGDYAVLSHPDLCILALTYSLHQREKAAAAKLANESVTELDESAPPVVETTEAGKALNATPAAEEIPAEASLEEPVDAEETATEEVFGEESEDEDEEDKDEQEDVDEQDLEPLDVELHPLSNTDAAPASTDSDPTANSQSEPPAPSPEPIFDDPSDSDDGEGEWITPSNVGLHKSRALDLLPDSDSARKGGKGKQKEDEVIGAGCMTADFAMQNVLLQMGLNLVGVEGKRIQKVKSWVLRCHACFNHLKSNFQYRVRGTKYSIPAPKPGSAKTGTGEGLILRETRRVRPGAQDGGRAARKEEAKINKGADGARVGMDGDLPAIGYGRKNPNASRKKRK